MPASAGGLFKFILNYASLDFCHVQVSGALYFCSPMIQNFKSLALTYKTAPLAVREDVSLTEAAVKKLLHFVRDYTAATDVLIVSTCNRTEIYYCATEDLGDEILKGLSIVKHTSNIHSEYFHRLEGLEAVRHLFDVAIGLDAQIIGDLQISGQVKNAYQWTADENMAGPFLHRLLHTIFFCNKRVVQETAFRDGAASISYAAKELAEDLTGVLAAPKALVVGVGEIGQDVCLNLVNSRIADVTILNRTFDKAENLASKCNFRAGSFDQLANEIAKADVIISSVSGSEPLITEAFVRQLDILSHKFFIDLSMPRSVEASVDHIPGVIVYNLDDLRERTNEAVERRRASIPLVQQIISEAIEEFQDWSKEMIVSPTIQKLKNALETIRKEELARFIRNAQPSEAEKLDEMSKSMMQKILKYPVLQLKAACKRGDAESVSELLNELFNLDQTDVKSR